MPKKTWEKMTEEEKEQTERKKVEGSKSGRQFVGNTEKAREGRKEVSEEVKGKDEQGEGNGEGDEDGEKDEDESEQEYVNDDDDDDDVGEEDEDGEAESEGQDEGEGDDENAQAGQKRKPSSRKGDQSKGPSKSQKTNQGKAKQQQQQKNDDTVGSKHQPAEEPAPKGSTDRLPKMGQKVQWKALPGYVDGEVVEIVTEEKEVEGKQVKGSEKDPRIVLKSSSSGKIAVHKPDACFYE